MRDSVSEKISAALVSEKRRALSRGFLALAGVAVSLMTVYALILPAVTMANQTFCGHEEHAHSDACTEMVLLCGYEEAEVGEDTRVVTHSHSDVCYKVTSKLTCELEESESHAHSDDCCTSILTCTDTAEDHKHVEGCYADELICGLEEVESHSHSDACYTTISELTCGLEEGAVVETVVVEPAEESVETHVHTDVCYEKRQVCELEEHGHTLECYADKDADVETASEWEATLPEDEELTGVWADDLLLVAKSQLGYAESASNYVVLEDGETIKGYTRYGAWYGDAYGDWCAMFVSFCLHYAGVAEELMPQDANCQNWIEALSSDDVSLWRPVVDGVAIVPSKAITMSAGEGDGAEGAEPAAYEPRPGDLIFFNWDSKADSDHVGLVYELVEATEDESAKVKTIEGNSGDMVRYVEYELTDVSIMGYAALPENPAAELTAEERAQVEEVIELIDALPTSEEAENQILAYEDAENMISLENYYQAVGQKGWEAYYAYEALSETQKAFVTNYDKLMDLSWLWSAVTYIEDIDSDAPSIVQSASTAEFIELNLYDYNGSVNANYNSNNNWPGFQWNGGAYDKGSYNRHAIDYIDFGNSMITDRDYAGSDNAKATTAWNIGNQGGAINKIVEYPTGDYANKPVGMSTGADVLSRTLGSDGYPQVLNAGSMKGYFTASAFSDKKNTVSIDGLFQKNEVTGEYYYNSRWNHAQYSNNKFTLYEDIITPNFITYPFGNFLPLNDITNSANATQVGAIDDGLLGDYVQGVINDLVYDSSGGTTEQQLIDMLAKYRANLQGVSTSGGTAWTTWSAKDAIHDYLDAPTDGNLSPITDNLLNKMYNIDYDVDTNFFFGMDMSMTFMQPKGGMTGNDTNQDGKPDYPMEFYFTGDDDVWVYIDDALFLDLSGIHRHVGGKIDFVNGKVYYYHLDPPTGDVSTAPYATYTFAELLTAAGKSTSDLNSNGTFTDYSTHEFKFFYMERGSGSSVCRLNFNFPLLKQNSISVSKDVDSEDELLGDPDYKFQVLKANALGVKSDELFIGANTEYTIYDLTTNAVLGTGITNANGVFTLKAGQRAEFDDIREDSGKYYVRELLDGTVLGQYGNITVSGESTTTSNNVTVGNDTFTGMDSPVKDISDGTTAFRFINHVDVSKFGTLNVSKKLSEYDDVSSEKTYDVQVTLDGELLPAGITYKVGDEARTVETAGIISITADETATIFNILAGTTFEVEETSGSAKGYFVTYAEDGNTTIEVKDGVATGIVTTDANVQLVVTNSEKGATVSIPGSKSLSAYDGSEHVFAFRLDEVTDRTGAKVKAGGVSNYAVTSKVADIAGSFAFDINYVLPEMSDLPAIFYYRITENASSEALANNTVYVVEVTVTETESESGATAAVTNMWKGVVDETGVPAGLTPCDSLNADFANTLVGDLVLSKTVVGTATDQGFKFAIALYPASSGVDLPDSFAAVFYQQDGEEINTTLTPDENGVISLSDFKSGERAVIHGIPYGTKWKVTESDADGYEISYTVTAGESANDIAGATAEGSVASGLNEIVCTNTQMYELPETGGAGTYLCTFAGLTLVGAALFHIWNIRRRKETDKTF